MNENKKNTLKNEFIELVDSIFGNPADRRDEEDAIKVILMFMVMERLDRIADALEPDRTEIQHREK
ncbi:hypothetical protein [Muricomes intestini]|jgi:hypothetical protein|uniref:hypothetical protein n=1 Tax=Muricomes intestini TaxID=1796634 RepID=UPI002FDA142A